MRGIVGLATLAFIGIIIADLAMHPDALKAGANGLQGILVATYSGMLGQAPHYNPSK